MSVNVKTNSSSKALAETSNISNPNLLINSNFKINQQGLNTYTENGYRVDRWRNYSITMNIKSDGGIILKNNSSEVGNIVQPLNNKITEDCTLSVYVESISGSCHTYSTYDPNKYIVLKEGLNIITLTGCDVVVINLNPGASITLKYTKLEKGSIATPYVEPDPILELAKCKYYAKWLDTIYPAFFQYSSDESCYFIAIPAGDIINSMRISPYCSIQENYKAITLFTPVNCALAAEDHELTDVRINIHRNIIQLYFKDLPTWISNNAKSLIVQFNKSSIWLDAEIY